MERGQRGGGGGSTHARSAGGWVSANGILDENEHGEEKKKAAARPQGAHLEPDLDLPRVDAELLRELGPHREAARAHGGTTRVSRSSAGTRKLAPDVLPPPHVQMGGGACETGLGGTPVPTAPAPRPRSLRRGPARARGQRGHFMVKPHAASAGPRRRQGPGRGAVVGTNVGKLSAVKMVSSSCLAWSEGTQRLRS